MATLSLATPLLLIGALGWLGWIPVVHAALGIGFVAAPDRVAAVVLAKVVVIVILAVVVLIFGAVTLLLVGALRRLHGWVATLVLVLIPGLLWRAVARALGVVVDHTALAGWGVATAHIFGGWIGGDTKCQKSEDKDGCELHSSCCFDYFE